MDCTPIFKAAHAAGKDLNLVDAQLISKTLLMTADAAEASSDKIIAANKLDLARMDASDPRYDRLLLS